MPVVYAQVVIDTAGKKWAVRSSDGFEQAWFGVPVKTSGHGYVLTSTPTERLVRKAGTRLLSTTAITVNS